MRSKGRPLEVKRLRRRWARVLEVPVWEMKKSFPERGGEISGFELGATENDEYLRCLRRRDL